MRIYPACAAPQRPLDCLSRSSGFSLSRLSDCIDTCFFSIFFCRLSPHTTAHSNFAPFSLSAPLPRVPLCFYPLSFLLALHTSGGHELILLTITPYRLLFSRKSTKRIRTSSLLLSFSPFLLTQTRASVIRIMRNGWYTCTNTKTPLVLLAEQVALLERRGPERAYLLPTFTSDRTRTLDNRMDIT